MEFLRQKKNYMNKKIHGDGDGDLEEISFDS